MLVHTCLNCILLFGIFVLVANAVNSEETTVQNATQINNQTCPMRVKGHLVNLMDEHLNDKRPQIEASVINATRLMLEEEFVPNVTYKFNQEISVTGGFLHQHMEKLALEFRREVNRVEIKFDAVVTQKNREIEELKTKHENLKLKCENLEVKTKALEGTSASLQTKNSQLESKVTNLNTKLQQIEREYKAADKTLNTKNTAVESKATSMNTTLQWIEREYKAADITLNTKIIALESKATSMNTKMQQIEREYKAADTLNLNLRSIYLSKHNMDIG